MGKKKTIKCHASGTLPLICDWETRNSKAKWRKKDHVDMGIYIWQSRKGGEKAMACYWENHGNPSEVGQLHFVKGQITPPIVAHEAVHAAMHAWQIRKKKGRKWNEEEHCYRVQRIVESVLLFAKEVDA